MKKFLVFYKGENDDIKSVEIWAESENAALESLSKFMVSARIIKIVRLYGGVK